MTRRERLVYLLENYVDVENGLQDRAFRGDDFTPRMCRAWKHPSYVELRRCVALLQDHKPVLYWDLAETYFRYTEVRIAYCPRCLREAPPALEGHMHRHGQKTISLVPKIKRKISRAVRPENVRDAIDWIDEQFQAEPFIPDDLLMVAA